MTKKATIISVVVFILAILLRNYEVLTGYENSLTYLIPIAVSIGLFFHAIDQYDTYNDCAEKPRFENLDFLRYFGAVLIVILHLRPFKDISYPLDLLFNNMISRLFVPFFFITSGYFVAKKQKQNPAYFNRYIKGLIPSYLIWCLIYLPFGLQYIKEMGLSPMLYPVGLLVGILYSGTYYHLWYYPALIVALLFTNAWLKRFKLSSLLIVSFLLFALGATETYFGLLPNAIQTILNTYYYNIFITTRNFLFFGTFFVAMGYAMEAKNIVFVKASLTKLVVSFLLFLVEVMLLQKVDRLDSNLMFMTIPTVFYMFTTALQLPFTIRMPFKESIREYYKYYYLIHPLIIYGVLGVIKPQTTLFGALVLTLVTLVLTHIASWCFIQINRRYKSYKKKNSA
ncbi:acyltransferase family protein [Erysipelothrix aquatica]|uniref:acyltransferase family protein n=1 Tax=Erysipelothrix aquatica TaxID=2683714 RepID=UPI001359DC6D|nr:acyltransferase [Erysipelothrix aquatica]